MEFQQEGNIYYTELLYLKYIFQYNDILNTILKDGILPSMFVPLFWKTNLLYLQVRKQQDLSLWVKSNILILILYYLKLFDSSLIKIVVLKNLKN